jgi:hypothetical protein
MTCRALINQDPFCFTHGYNESSPMKPSMVGDIPVDVESVEQAADEVFVLLNMDDRPNGQHERSLSVGDVVLVKAGSEPVKALAVEGVGFREITNVWTEESGRIV